MHSGNWKSFLLRLIIPHIPLRDLYPMIGISILGAVLTGIYGIVHDQVTYSISPEYFTNFKFHQFDYADFGFHDRIFVSIIGFLATWWVGFFCVWFLARRLMPEQPRAKACKQIGLGFSIVCASGILFAIGGYVLGLLRGPDADYAYWARMIHSLQITEPWAFIRVAYIHNASYLGGILGLILALLFVRPSSKSVTPEETVE